MDAAIATNACLGFLEPTSSGVGGDCFAMLWDPKGNRVIGIAGSGRSPRKLTLEIARSRAVDGHLPPRRRCGRTAWRSHIERGPDRTAD